MYVLAPLLVLTFPFHPCGWASVDTCQVLGGGENLGIGAHAYFQKCGALGCSLGLAIEATGYLMLRVYHSLSDLELLEVGERGI